MRNKRDIPTNENTNLRRARLSCGLLQASPAARAGVSRGTVCGIEAGRLPEQTLQQIYKRLLKSDGYSYKVLCDIHRSFNHAGIAGLRRPRRP